MSTMSAVVQYEMKKGCVELRDLPVPEIGDHEVLLRVRGVGVCGSDVHQYHNTQSWTVGVPVVLGHEFCGEIAAVGKAVKGWKEGDRVANETAAEIDLDCPLTRQGMYNLDPSRQAFGCNRDGAMAQYVKVPTRTLHRIPKNVPFEVAAMTEPCCVAYQASVVNARIKPGDVVVVIGPGPIGLLCATMARLSGAGRVILVGIGRDKARMEIGLKAGATDVFAYAHDHGQVGIRWGHDSPSTSRVAAAVYSRVRWATMASRSSGVRPFATGRPPARSFSRPRGDSAPPRASQAQPSGTGCGQVRHAEE